MRSRMLGDPATRLLNDFIRDDHGTSTPALVSGLIDITVIAGKIAAAVQLQHDLTQSERVVLRVRRRPAHVQAPSESDGRTEFLARPKFGVQANATKRVIDGHRTCIRIFRPRDTTEIWDL